MLFLFLISAVHCKNDFVVRHLQILIFENVKNEHSVEKSVSVTDTVFLKRSEQPLDVEQHPALLWFRKERAPVSPAVPLPGLSMLHTSTDGNLLRAPGTCL